MVMSDLRYSLLCIGSGGVEGCVVGVKNFVDATTALVRLPTLVRLPARLAAAASAATEARRPWWRRSAGRRRGVRAADRVVAAAAAARARHQSLRAGARARHGARVGLGGWRWRSGRAYTGQRVAPDPQMLSQIGERVRHLFAERFESWARGHSAVLAWPTGQTHRTIPLGHLGLGYFGNCRARRWWRAPSRARAPRRAPAQAPAARARGDGGGGGGNYGRSAARTARRRPSERRHHGRRASVAAVAAAVKRARRRTSAVVASI